MSYRLQKFGLTTLETRRLRGDLLEVFNTFNGFDNIKLNDFLRASAMLKHVIDIGWTSVRPSVRLSVRHTLVLYQNG